MVEVWTADCGPFKFWLFKEFKLVKLVYKIMFIDIHINRQKDFCTKNSLIKDL